MALLILFAFLAGVGTALSPCVLPVLPVALSAGASGGPRRPLGIVTGLALSFTFATVALVYVIHALGLPDGLLRTLAIVALIGFGVALVVPPFAARIEAWLSSLTGRAGSPSRRGDGFWSGVLVGVSLGFVYAPCAGPLLAGVITVSASQSFTAGRLATAFAYGIGSALALYVLMRAGRRLTARLAARSMRFQQALGAVMVAVAVLMLANVDMRFQTAIASDLPSFLVNPTEKLENSGSARKELAGLRGDRRSAKAGGGRQAARGSRLPVIAPAPEIVGTQRWFNTPGGRPLTLASLRARHRVVLIDFWTYTCINCLRTLPHVTAWDARYRKDGLTVIGVHTPEFPFERSASNVSSAVRQNGIRYPVAQDNDRATWDAFGNQYWPAKYLIDANGHVRYVHFGEGEYGVTESAIRSLLAEAGADRLGAMTRASAQVPAEGVTTPETYLGAARAEGFANGPIAPGSRDYGRGRPALPPDAFAFRGRWRVGLESARAGPGARLHVEFQARRVFLVLGSPGRARAMRVLLDGKPLPDRLAGSDVRGGVARIEGQRLYRLVDLPAVGRHELTLAPAAGIEGYAFTFG
ncbi:MAG TPA: cytochrome c biogenesis protein DipZ [Thermoleophilaceae bacterium]|jgi:cytochrome c biogenesis protein CcdA/thiol-disulfide isomerase/thioredoxin